MRLFSLGVLAAITALLGELMLFSVFPTQSLLLLALAVPLFEESLKFGLLWKGRDALPKSFSIQFFSAAFTFGLGFAIPETILAGLADPLQNPFTLMGTLSIHLISAFFLASAILFLMRRRPLSTFSLCIFSFSIHALYNFFIFMQ
ncbi:MAG: hypothetical protein WBO66_04165 [Candidatus Moraniibacteriota bacterium]